MSGRSTDDKKPMSMAWLFMGIGFAVQFVAFLLSFVAFFAPFWYIELNTGYQTGLWGRCDGTDNVCIWFLERDYAWEKFIPKWHVAAQVLFAFGIILLFLSLMMSVGQLLFRCCKTVFVLPTITGVIILVAMLSELIAITAFGVGAYNQFEVSLNSWVGQFQWAFYVAIADLFICSFAGMIFIYAGTKYQEEMKGYTMSYGS